MSTCEHQWHFRDVQDDPKVIAECYCQLCYHSIQIMKLDPTRAKELYERHGRNFLREGIHDPAA